MRTENRSRFLLTHQRLAALMQAPANGSAPLRRGDFYVGQPLSLAPVLSADAEWQ